MARTHASTARQVHGGGAAGIPGVKKITTVLLPQSLADTDLGDLLHQQESKILKRNPQKAACHYTKVKAINRCGRSSQVSSVDSISLV